MRPLASCLRAQRSPAATCSGVRRSGSVVVIMVLQVVGLNFSHGNRRRGAERPASAHRPRKKNCEGGEAPTGALGFRPAGRAKARHTLARRVECPARTLSPLGAPPRRFREAARRPSHRPRAALAARSEQAPVVQQAPCTRVIVPVGRGPEASRESGRLSQTRRRRPCFCQQAPPVDAPQQAGYGNTIPRNMILSSRFAGRCCGLWIQGSPLRGAPE